MAALMDRLQKSSDLEHEVFQIVRSSMVKERIGSKAVRFEKGEGKGRGREEGRR